MGTIFHELIYQPIYNLIVFVYDFFPGGDFGIAIIIVTVLLKSVLIPLSKKQIQSQKRIQEIQPELKRIQEKYKDDKEKQTKEIMNFYKNNKVNPFSGCLPIIIQIIFLIAIYRVIINISSAGLVVNEADLYSFVRNPGEINKSFLGLVDLLKPSIPIAVLAAVAQFWQTKMMMGKNKKDKNLDKKADKNKDEPDFSEIMNKQMMILGPFLTLFIGLKFAAGLSIYWLVSTLFSIVQQVYVFRASQQKEK